MSMTFAVMDEAPVSREAQRGPGPAEYMGELVGKETGDSVVLISFVPCNVEQGAIHKVECREYLMSWLSS